MSPRLMLDFWTTWCPLWASRLINLAIVGSFINVIYQVYSHHEIVEIAQRAHLSNNSTIISSENVTNSLLSLISLLLVRVGISAVRTSSTPI